MTGDTVIDLNYTFDLSEPLRVTQLRNLFVAGNQLAHRFVIALREADLAPLLTDATVDARFVRADGSTVHFAGSTDSNKVIVQLPAACYAVPGRFTLDVRVALSSSITSVFYAEGSLVRSATDAAVADPAARIPTWDELIAKVSGFENELSHRDRVPNLISNGYFPSDSVVNQRGAATYTGTGYGIDRWFSAFGTTVADVTAEGLKLTHNGESGSAYCGVFQIFPDRVHDRYKDATLTVAVCRADGTITVRSGVPSAGAVSASLPNGFAQLQIYADSDGSNHMRLRLMHSDKTTPLTVRWVAVFPGAYTADSLPAVFPPDYDRELLLCRRYYRKYLGLLLAGVAHGTNSFAAALDTSGMVALPSLASAEVAWIDAGGTRLISGMTPAISSQGRLNITTTAALPTNEGGAAYFSTLELSCEP